jgi:hypothetical protein
VHAKEEPPGKRTILPFYQDWEEKTAGTVANPTPSIKKAE